MKRIELHKLLAQQIRGIRERRRLSQEQLAGLAEDHGLNWKQDTVALIELGRRKLNLEEFLLLPSILDADDNELFPEDCQVVLTPTISVGSVAVSIKNYQVHDSHLLRVGKQVHKGSAKHKREVMDLEGRGTAAFEHHGKALRNAEVNAARKFGVTPRVIVAAAQRLWKRSLPEERDARLTPAGEGTMPIVGERRTLQALRGHITRQLLNELRKEIKQKMPKSKQRETYRVRTTKKGVRKHGS